MKMRHFWLARHVREVETQDTGGGCVVDVLTLVDGRVLVIADDAIALYASMAHWQQSGECPEPYIDRHAPIEVPAPHEALYRCDWFAPEYVRETVDYDATFFTDQVGYTAEYRAAIFTLEVGKAWLAPSPFGRTHTVTRIR